jgi:hypothetical protein
MSEELEERVLRLLDESARVFRGHERASLWLRRHRERMTEPLRLALIGPPASGKSTLVNALIGEEVAPVDGAAAWFHDGTRPLARVFPAGAPPYTAGLRRSPAGAGHVITAEGAGRGEPGDAPRVVVEWPCRALRHTRLLDTPGEAGEGSAAGNALTEADAVLHVTRHLGEDDLEPLQRVRPGRGAGAFPINVMVVLSRVDETAGGRADALVAGKRIARRRRRDPRVATLCQDVLAVSGRLAVAGRTLRAE